MVSANQFSRCYHCGPGGTLSPTFNRFCGSPMPDLSPGDGITTPETCGIALEKRQPILVNSKNAHVVRLEFPGYPDEGLLIFGSAAVDEGAESFGYVRISDEDNVGSPSLQYARIEVRNGDFYLSKSSSNVLVEVDDESVTSEVRLSPMCRIRFGPSLVYYFLP